MNTTTKEFAIELCKQLGISVKKWEDLNQALLDAYFEGLIEGRLESQNNPPK